MFSIHLIPLWKNELERYYIIYIDILICAKWKRNYTDIISFK